MSSKQPRGVDDDRDIRVWAGLDAKERTVLVEVARIEATGAAPFGAMVREECEQRLEIIKSTFYRVLDRLVEQGLLERGQINDRVDKYNVTPKAHEAMAAGQEYLSEVVEKQGP